MYNMTIKSYVWVPCEESKDIIESIRVEYEKLPSYLRSNLNFKQLTPISNITGVSEWLIEEIIKGEKDSWK